MRLLIGINRVCYAACLLAIIGGAFLAVIAIWTDEHDVGWKGIATTAVLIFAAILVLATNAIIGTKVMDPGGGIRDFLPSRFAPESPGRREPDELGEPGPLAGIVQARRDAATRRDEAFPPDDDPEHHDDA